MPDKEQLTRAINKTRSRQNGEAHNNPTPLNETRKPVQLSSTYSGHLFVLTDTREDGPDRIIILSTQEMIIYFKFSYGVYTGHLT
ncbi:unnamed protein product [Brachionus calyciflorus]|uniref:Uncharacterized protein n=1 Tax=Brachionus calyciflorus TaxID=104777 RepID=A0A814RF53_9BILA|nr:unnamed protein product [Brachionus calyciflorus]